MSARPLSLVLAAAAGGALAAFFLRRKAARAPERTERTERAESTYRVPAARLDTPGLEDRTLRKCETILLRRSTRILVVVSCTLLRMLLRLLLRLLRLLRMLRPFRPCRPL